MTESFAVPQGWHRTHRGGVVTATRPGSPLARLELRRGSTAAYSSMVVEDEDAFDLEGHEVGYRRIGHRRAGVELLTEEWTWHLDGTALVLTGTVERDDYLSVCDLFEDVAGTVDPEGGAA